MVLVLQKFVHQGLLFSFTLLDRSWNVINKLLEDQLEEQHCVLDGDDEGEEVQLVPAGDEFPRAPINLGFVGRILDRDEHSLVSLAREEHFIAVDDDAADTQVLEVIQPVSDTDRSLGPESPLVLKVGDLRIHPDTIRDNGEESSRRKHATEYHDVAKLLHELLVKEENIRLLGHHFEVAVDLVGQCVFDDLGAAL